MDKWQVDHNILTNISLGLVFFCLSLSVLGAFELAKCTLIGKSTGVMWLLYAGGLGSLAFMVHLMALTERLPHQDKPFSLVLGAFVVGIILLLAGMVVMTRTLMAYEKNTTPG